MKMMVRDEMVHSHKMDEMMMVDHDEMVDHEMVDCDYEMMVVDDG